MNKKFNPIQFRYDIKKYIEQKAENSPDMNGVKVSVQVDKDANGNKFILIKADKLMPESLYRSLAFKLKSDNIAFTSMVYRDLIMVPFNQKLKYLVIAPTEFNLSASLYAIY